MPAEVFDLVKMFKEDHRRKVIFNTPRMHAWLHIYPEPGDKDDMHCHNRDQTWYLIEGQCTIHFVDQPAQVMKPGMVVAITGGTFYQLENTGDGPMVLMGNRSGASDGTNVHINYETKQDVPRTPEGGRATGPRMH
jgi:mannose-6-phosphate isomerase-like protein (cupin superfamily)